MFTTTDDIQSTLLRLLTRQSNNGGQHVDSILASAILDLHDLMLTMDSSFTHVVWANEGMS